MPSSIAAAAGEDAGALVELRATTDGLLVAESPHAPAIKTNDTRSRLFTVADASTTSSEVFASEALEGTFTSNDLLRAARDALRRDIFRRRRDPSRTASRRDIDRADVDPSGF
jgi:hypothetical protein